MLEGKLTQVRFPSWCNVFDDNVAMLDGKLHYQKPTHINFYAPCNVLRMKANSC